MLRRRGIKARRKILPVAYREVEYLESSGTQKIETGYVPKPTNTHELSLIFSPLSITGIRIFCSCPDKFPNADNGQRFQFPANGAGLYSQANGAPDWSVMDKFGDMTIGAVYTLSLRQMQVSCLGQSFPVSFLASGNTSQLGIFGQPTSEANTRFIGRIYYFCYKISGVEQVELIPCYRIADGKPGMYDTARSLFLTNSGSGEFVCGPAIY